jgi:hypothetical protein
MLQILCVCDGLTKWYSRLSETLQHIARATSAQPKDTLVQTPSSHQERSTSKGLSRLVSNVGSLPQHESAQRIALTLWNNRPRFPFWCAPLFGCTCFFTYGEYTRTSFSTASLAGPPPLLYTAQCSVVCLRGRIDFTQRLCYLFLNPTIVQDVQFTHTYRNW